MRRLATLFPSTMLRDHAEEIGVVERDGKIPALVWTFVFGFAAGESRALAGFRRSTTLPQIGHFHPAASTSARRISATLSSAVACST